jgi:hypothetical protein
MGNKKMGAGFIHTSRPLWEWEIFALLCLVSYLIVAAALLRLMLAHFVRV